tara:strand:+ start:249 stop:500 length:252 start_codon:yes stop_codon:yes gene_type:complete
MTGWEDLQSNVVPLETVDETDRKYLKVFSTKAGREVLEHLKTLTIDQPTWTPGEDPSYGYAREGQNSLVRDIIRRIERARNHE